MRVNSPAFRTAMKAASVALLWLLTASLAEAAPRRAGALIGAQCDPQATLRKGHHPKKPAGGPVARNRRAKSKTGLIFDFRACLHRTARPHLDDDRDAIQNDDAATAFDCDDRAIPGLRPLGIVLGPFEGALATLAFSPRSPRGPPDPV